ncbi:MAG: GFA family protein [Phenylobacterium sp.]|uniref:GFA family protein n=1 Tax=Phenylobacterium sp. TaxID=1871053 RepID=UPI002724391D|nr:GFA family protein [Phenylobacterium sp.]MDO8409785.1 GFA family protein [Phenylobacterium sp.]
MSMTGGCQCGAVRFRVDGELGEASICHCRMCQKAMGGLFGPFVEAPVEALVWTRGEPRRFQSSNKVRRGFCGDCGTPLTFEYGDRHVGLAIGALDRPAEVGPSVQLASPSKLPYFDDIATLPVHPTDEPAAAAHLAGIVSYQHPDHDTVAWRARD